MEKGTFWGFASNHPIITFLLGTSAIWGVVGIVHPSDGASSSTTATQGLSRAMAVRHFTNAGRPVMPR